MRRSVFFALTGISAMAVLAGTVPAQAAPAAAVTTGTVTGTVVNAAGGAALSGICVNVVDASTNQTVGTSAATGSTGVWQLKGVAPSTTYTATAFGCSNRNFVSQWYDHQDFQDRATSFGVVAGKTTKFLDFSLSEGGSISGTVTDSVTNAPVAGILVIAYSTAAQEVSTFAQCTSAAGGYTLIGVPTSGAKLQFLPNDCGTSSTYRATWYKSHTSYAKATVVPVTAGKTKKSVNQVVTASTG